MLYEQKKFNYERVVFETERASWLANPKETYMAYQELVAADRQDRADRRAQMDIDRDIWLTEKAEWEEQRAITQAEEGEDSDCNLDDVYYYKKSSVTYVVATSWAQVAAHVYAYNQAQSEAFKTYYGRDISTATSEETSQRLYITDRVTFWEYMATAYASVHGLVAIFGTIYLLTGAGWKPTAWLIQHWFGNLYHSMGYLAAGGAAYYATQTDSKDQDETLFQMIASLDILSTTIQWWVGADAVYYLRDGDLPHADPVLLPSLAYLFIEHEPRFGYGEIILEEGE